MRTRSQNTSHSRIKIKCTNRRLALVDKTNIPVVADTSDVEKMPRRKLNLKGNNCPKGQPAKDLENKEHFTTPRSMLLRGKENVESINKSVETSNITKGGNNKISNIKQTLELKIAERKQNAIKRTSSRLKGKDSSGSLNESNNTSNEINKKKAVKMKTLGNKEPINETRTTRQLRAKEKSGTNKTAITSTKDDKKINTSMVNTLTDSLPSCAVTVTPINTSVRQRVKRLSRASQNKLNSINIESKAATNMKKKADATVKKQVTMRKYLEDTKIKNKTTEDTRTKNKTNNTSSARLRDKNKNKSPIKTVQIEGSLETPKMTLRQRKTKTYKQLSDELSPTPKLSTSKTKDTHHVPVYKRIAKEKIKTKKKRDVYDFDATPKNKKQKANQTIDEHNTSTPFEMYMKYVIESLEKKDKKKKPKTNASTKLNKSSIVKKRKPKEIESKKSSKNKKNVVDVEIVNWCLGRKPAPNRDDDMNSPVQFYADNSDDETDNVEMPHNKVTEETNNAPRVKILSNVLINRSQENDTTAESSVDKSIGNNSNTTLNGTIPNNPMANSTMVNAGESPWRPDFVVNRNSYFLKLKNSFLPTYNQDMVMDSSVVERFPSTGEVTRSGTHRDGTEGNKRQKSITSFLGNGEDASRPHLQCSLFDTNDFSPIKRNPTSGGDDKENELGKKEKRTGSVKKKILGESNTNVETASNLNVSDDFFGFDKSDKEEKRLSGGERCGKPTRLEKYVHRKNKNVARENLTSERASNDDDDVNESGAIERFLDEDVENVEEMNEDAAALSKLHLFEDAEPEKEPNAVVESVRTYKPRRTKKKVIKFVDVDDSDNEESKSHKKKKNARTKEEEEECEKWAAAFNTTCEEIEKFPLCIE